MNLEDLKHHFEIAIGYNSTVKGVPVSEENLELCRTFVSDIHGCARQDVRVMYRGPRTSSAYVTLKKDAHSFDVYCNPRRQENIVKTATIEILEEGETIFGSRTAGEYFVRRYEDGEEMGGGFFKTMEEAETEVREYQEIKT